MMLQGNYIKDQGINLSQALQKSIWKTIIWESTAFLENNFLQNSNEKQIKYAHKNLPESPFDQF